MLNSTMGVLLNITVCMSFCGDHEVDMEGSADDWEAGGCAHAKNGGQVWLLGRELQTPVAWKTIIFTVFAKSD